MTKIIMASSSPVHISSSSRGSSSHTGLVTSTGNSRSYGTLKDSPNLSFLGSGVSSLHCIHHAVEEGDTLQGLALKYNVTVQQIRRLNNLWNTDSLHIRLILKIPISQSNDSSRSNSPLSSAQRRSSSEQIIPNGRRKSETFSGSLLNGGLLEDDEEVRSKNSSRRYESESVDSDEGVKTIASILNSADERLVLARQFAEKLAQRCTERAPPEGSYNRTADMKSHLPTNRHSRSQSPSLFSSLSISTQSHKQSKIVKHSSDKDSESRERVENQLFEL